jgi:hypothetical protein
MLVRLGLAARLSFVRNPRGVKRATTMPHSVPARLESCVFIQPTSRPLFSGMRCGCGLRLCHTLQTTKNDRRCAYHSHDFTVMTMMLTSSRIKL